jgi:hypothetical protein
MMRGKPALCGVEVGGASSCFRVLCSLPLPQVGLACRERFQRTRDLVGMLLLGRRELSFAT